MNPNDIYLSFDLDNTLIKNQRGIVNSFNHALEKYTKEKISKKYIRKMIGMPLREMFEKVLDDSVDKYIVAFRQFYGILGIYQSKFIKGAVRKLEELKNEGFHMGVLSSKKHEMVIRITEILGINKYFDLRLGETEERKKKYDISTKSLLSKEFPDKKIVVIGDHVYDVKVAEMLGCPFIGVLTGTTSKKTLKRNLTVPFVILRSIRKIKPKIISSLIN